MSLLIVRFNESPDIYIKTYQVQVLQLTNDTSSASGSIPISTINLHIVSTPVLKNIHV